MKVHYTDSIKYKMLARIQSLPGNVILREDLIDLGSYRQISRGLKVLQKEGVLSRIGAGVYAKSYFSPYINEPVLKGGFAAVCLEALNRLGVKWELGTAAQAYNAGLSTQVPARLIIKLKDRCRRKLAYQGQTLLIEQGINAR